VHWDDAFKYAPISQLHEFPEHTAYKAHAVQLPFPAVALLNPSAHGWHDPDDAFNEFPGPHCHDDDVQTAFAGHAKHAVLPIVGL
jgi:hypothetical protein